MESMQGFTENTQKRLFNSNVKSVLLYGCETWRAMPSVLRKVQMFINRCLQKILKIKWQEKARNEKLWKKTQQRSIVEEIRQRRWRWIGHTLRKPGNNITRHALQWNLQGTRSRGRPCETWKRCVGNELLNIRHTWGELPQITQDRQRWKSLVHGIHPDRGERH